MSFVCIAGSSCFYAGSWYSDGIRIPYPSDNTKYFQCHDGSFIEHQCPQGTIYWTSIDQCGWPAGH